MRPLRRILSISEADLQTIDILYRTERLRHYRFHRLIAVHFDQSAPSAVIFHQGQRKLLIGLQAETIAGTGSNSTDEALEATRHVAGLGIKAALLVDPYYNGPSSLEVRREYYAPIAEAFPEVQLVPY